MNMTVEDRLMQEWDQGYCQDMLDNLTLQTERSHERMIQIMLMGIGQILKTQVLEDTERLEMIEHFSNYLKVYATGDCEP